MLSTKEKIITTVTKMLTNNISFDEISMSALAQEVGIGKSTIYDYFISKAELFKVAIQNLVEQIFSDIREFDISKYTFKDAFINQMIKFYELKQYKSFGVNFVQNNQQYIIEENKEIIECIEEMKNIFRLRFISIFEKGILEGTINPTNSTELSFLVNILIQGSVVCSDVEEDMDNKMKAEYIYNGIIKILK